MAKGENLSSIVLTEPVNIKMLVTPDFRKKYLDELEVQVDKIDEELQRLGEMSANASTGASVHNAIQSQQIQTEINRLQQMRQGLEVQFQQFQDLPEETEVHYTTIQSQLEVKVGDNFFQTYGKEIILKDGEVVEIRHAALPLKADAKK